jgi:hypothetical protein
MATLKLEQAASLHQGKDAPCSGATKGAMPSCSQRFFEIFQKFRQLCRDQSHKREVFYWKLKLEESKDDSLHGMARHYSFKALSANTPAATARRLADTSLVSGFHPTSFQERSSDHRDSGPKKGVFTTKTSAKVISRSYRGPGVKAAQSSSNSSHCLSEAPGAQLPLNVVRSSPC